MEKEKETKVIGGLQVNVEKIKIFTEEGITVESDPVVNDNGGELSATFEISRPNTLIGSKEPNRIVAMYTNELGETSAKSEIIGMSAQDKDKVAVWTFDFHGWEDYGRLQEIQVWENDILTNTITGDGGWTVQFNKGSRVCIKLIDKEDMDKYRYYQRKAILEIRDMIADEVIIDIDQLTVNVELNMDAVIEDRHFRLYYFDHTTLWSELAGVADKHNLITTYKEGDKQKPKFYYVTYNRCQTDILKVAFVEPEFYDGLYDENGNWNPDKFLEKFGRPADDKGDWLKWIIDNIEPVKDVDIELVQAHGVNIVWDILPKFDTTINKEQTRDIAVFTSYGQIQYARKFTIKYVPKKKSLFKLEGLKYEVE